MPHMLFGIKEAWTGFTARDMRIKSLHCRVWAQEERTYCLRDSPRLSLSLLFPNNAAASDLPGMIVRLSDIFMKFTASCLPGFQLRHGAALWPGRHLVQFTVFPFRILMLQVASRSARR